MESIYDVMNLVARPFQAKRTSVETSHFKYELSQNL